MVKYAIIAVDCQQEFFDHEGIFGQNHISPDVIMNIFELLKDTEDIAEHYLIQAIYGETPTDPIPLIIPGNDLQNDNFHASTHNSAYRDCCVRGTRFAELDGIIKCFAPSATIIEKNYYSSFTHTDLHDSLTLNGIDTVIICGATTNVCVQATACDAKLLGYNVIIPHNCTGATSYKRHDDAISYMRDVIGAEITTGFEIAARITHNGKFGLGSGKARVLYNVMRGESREGIDWSSAKETCQKLHDEVEWSNMYHAGDAVSRLVGVYGEILENGDKPIYRFPTDNEFDLKQWTNSLKTIQYRLSEVIGYNLNHGKIQYYRDGKSWIGAHSDKTLDIERGTDIVNISFGATRTMVLKHKTKKDVNGVYLRHEFELPHDSVCILDWKTNAEWTHSIKKETKPIDPRISIVYRSIATYITPDGVLYGQGAKSKVRVEATSQRLMQCNENSKFNPEESDKMFRAMAMENKPDFDWDKHYGEGFDQTIALTSAMSLHS